MKAKPGSKYDIIIKSGPSLIAALYKLCQSVWINESIPDLWKKSTLIQVYKGKGQKSDLDNMLHLHIKEEIPKFFGHIVMSMAKEKLLSNMSKYQIGAKPGHMPQEHLYVIKSVISLYALLGIPLFLTMWDMSKFFDRESLKDCMNELYKNEIRGKLYRLIYEMNKETHIRVQTPVGLTDECNTGEGLGQGTLEGAFVSAVNLDNGVSDFFKDSENELLYADIQMRPLLYQDDVARVCNSIESLQSANDRMEVLAETKLLDFNLSKSVYMLIGSGKDMKDMDTKLCQSPVTLCGQPMKRETEAKYLGDWISQSGLAESVSTTVRRRRNTVLCTISEIRSVVDDYRSNACGGLAVGLQIWETGIIPMLLYNAECWLKMNKNTMEELESLQRRFLRSLLGAGSGCPSPSLYWETGTLYMKYRIMTRKLTFLHHLLTLPDDSLAKEILCAQEKYSLPSLTDECKDILDELNISNIHELSKYQWKRLVKSHMRKKNKADLIGECHQYKKISFVETDTFERQSYLSELNVSEARMRFKIARYMVLTVQMNFKSDPAFTANRWTCSGCSGSLDTQAHILNCPGYSDLRSNLNLELDVDLVRYFHQVIRKRQEDEDSSPH